MNKRDITRDMYAKCITVTDTNTNFLNPGKKVLKLSTRRLDYQKATNVASRSIVTILNDVKTTLKVSGPIAAENILLQYVQKFS